MDDNLSKLINLCRQKGLKITSAESCTGGMIGAAITSIAGASDIYDGGVITYSNHAKSKYLQVPAPLIDKYGAVSHEVATAMAEGALTQSSAADIAISITGVAGPGQSENKPAGLVYIGVARKGEDTYICKNMFKGSRESVRKQTCDKAFSILLNMLSSPPLKPTQDIINEKIRAALNPISLEIINQSHLHKGHGGAPKAGDAGYGQSHFFLHIISDIFLNKTKIQRMRLVHNILKDEMKQKIHALSMQLETSDEANIQCKRQEKKQ